jgi:hypothetical protein
MAATTIGNYIPISTANEYILKFIADYFTTGKIPAKSFTIDAKMVCAFVQEHQNVVNLKFSLAENTTTSALTLVITGVDANGDYVTNGTTVMDQCNVCPPQCPSGTAGNDTI